jgi:DNA-binding MarR family transcriptional regulator
LKEKERLVEGILQLADKLFRKLFPTVPDELLSMDITLPQFKIMLLLFFHGSLRMSDIAAQLDVTLPTATSLVDRLVERDYVLRESQLNDRRVVLCHLSEKGRKSINRIWETASARSRELLGSLDENRLKMLGDVLETMLENADLKNGRIVAKSAETGSGNQ